MIQIYDPNQPIAPNNQVPSISISSLSTIGVPVGTSYSFSPYSQPGVSAVFGFAPEGITPTTNPSSVLPSIIVRAG